MKYIDSEKLIAEIERRLEMYDSDYTNAGSELNKLLSFVASLQREQPEVDLEKGIEEYFKGWSETDEGIACHYQYVDLNTCRGIARHFYELGLKSKK